jgi:hypothetical protein
MADRLDAYVEQVNREERAGWMDALGSLMGLEDHRVAQTGGFCMVPQFFVNEARTAYIHVAPPPHISETTSIDAEWFVQFCVEGFDRTTTTEEVGPCDDYGECNCPQMPPLPDGTARYTMEEVAEAVREYLKPVEVEGWGRFRVGEGIYYDVYPHGHDIPGIVAPWGVVALAERGETWDLHGLCDFCNWCGAYSIHRLPNQMEVV